jgi:hypothetical protein
MSTATWRLKVMTLRKHSPIRREKWLRENADAIAEYNALVARMGTFTSRRTQRSGSAAVADSAMGRDSEPLQGLFLQAIDRTVASKRR